MSVAHMRVTFGPLGGSDEQIYNRDTTRDTTMEERCATRRSPNAVLVDRTRFASTASARATVACVRAWQLAVVRATAAPLRPSYKVGNEEARRIRRCSRNRYGLRLEAALDHVLAHRAPLGRRRTAGLPP